MSSTVSISLSMSISISKSKVNRRLSHNFHSAAGHAAQGSVEGLMESALQTSGALAWVVCALVSTQPGLQKLSVKEYASDYSKSPTWLNDCSLIKDVLQALDMHSDCR